MSPLGIAGCENPRPAEGSDVNRFTLPGMNPPSLGSLAAPAAGPTGCDGLGVAAAVVLGAAVVPGAAVLAGAAVRGSLPEPCG